MKSKKLWAVLLSASMAASGCGMLSNAAVIPPISHSQPFSAMAVGPGVHNLSPADELTRYQWALKNDGDLYSTEYKQIQSLPPNIQQIGENPTADPGYISPGPGSYETVIQTAIPGIDINLLPAWELYDQSESKGQVTVAVIDTGIDITHPQLAEALWTNPGEIPGDGIDNDSNGYIDDIYGWNFYSGNNQVFTGSEDDHGTHAAGTIGAKRGDSGITGITDNDYVKIMSLKALGGAEGQGSADSIIQAIKYAEANGATICNLSLGTSFHSEELADAIQNSSMLFIVACGNGGIAGLGYSIDDFPVYPASYSFDNILSVANLSFTGQLDQSSNYGAQSVDLAAPGTYILSCIPGGQYGYMSGTSMAAPMVTGVAAVVSSYRPDLTPFQIKDVLIGSARPLESLQGKTASGGMLDAYQALQYPI